MFDQSNHGFRITFRNGWTVSVQHRDGNYCEHRFADPDTRDMRKSRDAEIAVISPEGEFVDDVLGWASPDTVAEIIAQTAAR